MKPATTNSWRPWVFSFSQSRGAPALRVHRARALADDPLEPLRPRGLQERRAVLERLGEPHDRVRPDDRGEPRPPLLERASHQDLTAGLEAVEGVVDQPRAPFLHRREARATAIVERADLPVEDSVAGYPAGKRRGDRREARREVLVVARPKRAKAAANVCDRPVAVELDLVLPGARGRKLRRERRQHRLVAAVRRSCVAVVAAADQEPVDLLAVEMRRHERPDSPETLAGEPDLQAAVPLLLQELVGAPVPDLDVARAVLPARDLAREGRVFERMVLDMNREGLLSRLRWDPLGNGPRGERPGPLEPEVVVEAPRRVLLHDEDRCATRLRARRSSRCERLRRLGRVALFAVAVQPVYLQPRLLPIHRMSIPG